MTNKELWIKNPINEVETLLPDYSAELVRAVNSKINFNLRLFDFLENEQLKWSCVLKYDYDYKRQFYYLKATFKELRELKKMLANLHKYPGLVDIDGILLTFPEYCKEVIKRINCQINFELSLIKTLENTRDKCWQTFFYNSELRNILSNLPLTIKAFRDLKIKVAALAKQLL